MAFASASSKAKAKATVNLLFEYMLPGSTGTLTHTKGSATEKFHREVSKQKLTKEEVKKIKKTEKAKKNKAINKRLEADKKFQKLVKYNVIKAHKDANKLSEEEQKYLRKLTKKNSSAVRRAGDVDDPQVKDEIEELRAEIVALTDEQYLRSKEKKQTEKLLAFTEKVKSGVMSYPGLTPGLAPVGFDDSDDE